ncbi:hypothetical protein [Pantanalinema sp. GBBB05]|uniref:hypothetical protein n=1 Tax=Pantanalinema sp. GBBB05 TaxID=2604139 RepID=UPI001D7219A5|nr:hypothetical protein [Pantanalinema sp. GBBB05]
MNTVTAALAAYFANGNLELTKLYNRCQFSIDDTAFTITGKKKDVTQFDDNELLNIAIIARQFDVRWLTVRSKKQVLIHLEIELMIRWQRFVLAHQER